MEFGKIVEVPLREVWAGEATHFTPWLAANLQLISEKLGLELELESVESAAGDFSADIIAKDVATNRRVIIENQYGGTDHRHLGQILTYSSVLNASVVIWIAERVRSEHKAAIDFLNLNLKETLQIFAIEANIIRIDDSKPAFGLKIICMPAEAATASTSTSAEITETREKYRSYFQSLLDELREVHKYTNARAAQPQNWYTFTSDNSKCISIQPRLRKVREFESRLILIAVTRCGTRQSSTHSMLRKRPLMRHTVQNWNGKS